VRFSRMLCPFKCRLVCVTMLHEERHARSVGDPR
jgi:hypothetical protein